MAKIAVTDGMAKDAVLMLREAGHEVSLLHSQEQLVDGFDAVVIRSATKMTAAAIADLPSLCKFVHFPLQAGSSRILRKSTINIFSSL